MTTALVGDLPIHTEDVGAGPPLLLVHGWGTSGAVWGPQQRDLATGRRVVTVDWAGCGRSGARASGNDLAGVVADLVEVIDHLALDHPVVVGSSIGAAFATELAVTHPDAVGGLVCVDGPAHWPASSGLDVAGLVAALRADRAAAVAGWVPGWVGPGASPALVAWTVGQILDSSPLIDAQLAAFSTYDPRPRLVRLDLPVLYLHGELDAQVPVAVARECAALTAGATVEVVPGVGHLPHQEAPAVVSAALSRFAR